MRLFQLNRRDFLFAPDDNGGGGGTDDKSKDAPPEPESLEAFLKDKPEADRKLLEKLLAKQTEGLKGALDKEREAREAAEKEKKRIEKERAKATEDKLAADKQFEELAKQRETRIGELEPQVATLAKERDESKAETAAALKVIEDLVEAQTKALKLDEATLELLSGKTAIEKLNWMTKHAEKFGKTVGLLPTTPHGEDPKGLDDEQRRKLVGRSW